MELSKIDKTQYSELCKLLLKLLPKSNKINKDDKNKNIDTRMALHSLLKNYNHNINFFEIILNMDRKERYISSLMISKLFHFCVYRPKLHI